MAKTEVFMSSNRQYTEEFKSEAVKQVVERVNRPGFLGGSFT